MLAPERKRKFHNFRVSGKEFATYNYIKAPGLDEALELLEAKNLPENTIIYYEIGEE